jgi:hypothetical protein
VAEAAVETEAAEAVEEEDVVAVEVTALPENEQYDAF